MFTKLSGAAALAPVLIALGACAPSTSTADESAVANLTCTQRLQGPAQILEVSITATEDRGVPLTVFAPQEAGTYPLIAFSHGAYSAPDRYLALLEPLAAAGYVIVAPMHVDSEEFVHAEGEPDHPPHAVTWAARNEDFALALNPPETLVAALGKAGLTLDLDRKISLGHSYGALIAQMPGGAIAIEPDGGRIERRDQSVDVVVGWSPPGPMEGFMAEEGWQGLSVPTLTITGTTDILPGFLEDWEDNLAAYDNGPAGQRAKWVGEGVDHYFGGVFGRVKATDENSTAKFKNALASSLNFIERHSNAPAPCSLTPAGEGIIYEEDPS